MSKLIDYTPFNVASARADIQQLYVSAADHIYIKEVATDNNVRMTAVVSALIAHAKTSEEVFKHLLSAIFAIDKCLTNGVKPSPELVTKLDALVKKYENLEV